jgi:hypothetical protein
MDTRPQLFGYAKVLQAGILSSHLPGIVLSIAPVAEWGYLSG